jgi:hypothetical protein
LRHPSEQRIDPSRIIGGSSKISPAEVERDDLGKVTITVLEWQGYLSGVALNRATAR